MENAINYFNSYFRRFFNLLIGIKWQCVLLLFLTSCGIHNQVNKDDNIKFPKDLSASFYDKLDTVSTDFNGTLYSRSLIKDLTNIDNIDYSKPIRIDLNRNELYINCETTNRKKYVFKYYGRRHNKRFVFYTNYKTISFPILIITKDVEKYEINFPNENEIVFENKSESQGMLLLIGAGRSSKSNYKFKLIRNE